ncbi:hypothetical protein [Clavibacter nebraskensis]|uniref:hypothetical protein n=1 Tax=Clavibacter nebraskensis TaxID=31963 RepID=UPI003F86E860
MTVPDASRTPVDDIRPALELRWPSVMVDGGDPEAPVVDVVNVGAERWIPREGDALLAFGALTEPGAPAPGIPFAFAGGPRGAVALDPGDSTRVPVAIAAGDWADLRPGAYDLHAALVLPHARRAGPLRVTVTADAIARRRAASPGRPPTDAELRRAHDTRIAWLRTRVAAADALTPLVAEVAGVASRADAVARIRALLGVHEEHAQGLLDVPLRDLLPYAAEATRREMAEAVARRDALPTASASDAGPDPT